MILTVPGNHKLRALSSCVSESQAISCCVSVVAFSIQYYLGVSSVWAGVTGNVALIMWIVRRRRLSTCKKKDDSGVVNLFNPPPELSVNTRLLPCQKVTGVLNLFLKAYSVQVTSPHLDTWGHIVRGPPHVGQRFKPGTR